MLDLHCAKKAVQGQTDWANDCYVRAVGDFTSVAGPHDIPGNDASLPMLKTDAKYFGGAVDKWKWATADWKLSGGRLDPGRENNKRKAVYNFKVGETYTLILSGRSEGFRIDRIMFRHTSVSAGLAQKLSNPESGTFTGHPPIPDDLDVTTTAAGFHAESHPGDEATIKKDGATNVASITNSPWR